MTVNDFNEAAEKAAKGEKVEVTPREIVRWFGKERRGRNVVGLVRKKFKAKKVTTEPDFESVWIDVPVHLVASPSNKPAKSADAKKPTAAGTGDVGDPASTVREADPATAAGAFTPVEPSHRISRLEAAGREPVSVRPSDKRDKAVTLMLQHDYSQLPVLQNKSTVKGMISWRSIGQSLHMGRTCETVEECMEPAQEVSAAASMFEVVPRVARHDAVLIREANNLISGMVTQADINQQFGNLGEPFLLIGDIETALRSFVEHSFDLQDLQAAVHKEDDPDRKVTSAHDLTFGETLRLIQNQERWEKLRLKLDRVEVCSRLERVREIRNDVMHFEPDPLDETSLKVLRETAAFFAKIVNLTR